MGVMSCCHGLATLAMVAGCGRAGFDALATNDAAAAPDAETAPAARVVSQAYWTNWFGTEIGTPGMSMQGYAIDASGVVDGELLLIVACIDNGSDTVWPTPLGPGFEQLHQKLWGNDGQTCAIDWKYAAGEPATYTGTYGPGIVSGSALIALVAIAGVTSLSPISGSSIATGGGAGVNPVMASSIGITTTVPDSLVLYATGSDWECYEVTDVTFTVPEGFTQLFLSSDRGGVMKDWTTFQIATRAMPEPGATGPITNTETSTGSASCVATPWTAALAIEP